MFSFISRNTKPFIRLVLIMVFFMKRFSQTSVQMESALTHKRKADEIDNGQDVNYGKCLT